MRDGTPGERSITRLLRHPERLLSTIVVGNMIVNTLLASVVAQVGRRIPGDWGVAIAIAATTVVLVVFGEVTPKTLAVYHSTRYSRFAAPTLIVLGRIFAPVRIVMQRATNVALAILGYQRMPAWSAMTQDEISAMLAMGEAAGVATDRERSLLENILNLGMIEARDIMVPRTEVIGIKDTATLCQAFKLARECRHSRLPVYGKDLDDLWGVFAVVNTPHLLSEPAFDQSLSSVRNLVENDKTDSRFPVFPVRVFPESGRVDDLLANMRAESVSMAALVDEYGGTAGILTIDDILEEVVGRIASTSEIELKNLEENGEPVMMDGHLTIRDFNKAAKSPLPLNGSSTLAGYVMELLGRIPRAGDEVADENYIFTVTRMAGRKIGALRVGLAPIIDDDEKKEEETDES